MEVNRKAQEAVNMIEAQLKELVSILDLVQRDKDYSSARERLNRWQSRTVKLLSEKVNPEEGTQLEGKFRRIAYHTEMENISADVDMYCAFLISLRETLEQHPEDLLSVETKEDTMILPVASLQPPITRAVFIVHGHDETNKLRLEKLLRERWDLEPIVLSYEAGKGRTLIEKFEQEAQRATYALVLITPDDLIEVEDARYTQARPNVIFELGWFYGRLGRPKVCILFKKGTKIHSDLDGITRIEFNEYVEEKIIELEKELTAAGLISE